MAYHGMLRPQFGPYYVDAAVSDTASQRAKSVGLAGDRLVRGEWTATMMTASWIHLGGQAPEMFEAATVTYQKSRLRSRVIPLAFRHIDYLGRDEVSDEDLLVIGGVVVTAPELTIEDLLRVGGTARHQQCALELACRVDVGQLQQRFADHNHLAGMDEACRLLDQMIPIVEAYWNATAA